MGPGIAVDAFVPIWIFAPILLIGIVGLIITPKANPTRLSGMSTRGSDPRVEVTSARGA
jgi:hypothetical protein